MVIARFRCLACLMPMAPWELFIVHFVSELALGISFSMQSRSVSTSTHSSPLLILNEVKCQPARAAYLSFSIFFIHFSRSFSFLSSDWSLMMCACSQTVCWAVRSQTHQGLPLRCTGGDSRRRTIRVLLGPL